MPEEELRDGAMLTRVDDYVEGEVLFDASRIREHRALYVDIAEGATDYGPVPSRHFVVYVPTFAWALAAVPTSLAKSIGRAVSLASWAGLLVWIVVRARRSCTGVAMAAGAFVLGAHALTYFASCARPDGVAIALAGVALERTVRRGRADALVGALFAAAALTKPNVVGCFAGVMIAELSLRGGRSALRMGLGALAVGVPSAACLHLVSGGAWLEHLVRSTILPMNAPAA